MDKKKIYCGIKKPGKNQKLGSMKECAETNQIRLYGVRKIDSRLLDRINKPKTNTQGLSLTEAENNVKQFRNILGKTNRAILDVHKKLLEIRKETDSKSKKINEKLTKEAKELLEKKKRNVIALEKAQAILDRIKQRIN